MKYLHYDAVMKVGKQNKKKKSIKVIYDMCCSVLELCKGGADKT